MRTITKVLYKFNELSKDAQEVAIREMTDRIGGTRVNFDSSDYEYTLEKIEEAFHIKVYDWEVGYGRGCPHYRFSLDTPFDEEKPEHLPRYFEYIWRDVHKGKYIGWRKKTKKPYYSKVLSNEESFSIVGMWTDTVLVNIMPKRYEYVRNGYSIEDFIKVILDKFFDQWQEDYEYSFSEECIREELEESGYAEDFEFTANGKPYKE